MIKLLCFFPILCASIAITPHASPSPIVSVKAHPVYKANKNVLTSTASVIKTIDSTPIENVKSYVKNKTVVTQNKTIVKQNNTNVSQLQNKTIVQEKTTHDPKNHVKKRSYLNIIMKICMFAFVIFIVIYFYYKLKKVGKPKKNQYLPLNVIDNRPVIHVTRNDFNPYNRDNEQCYKRLSGNNSPV